MKNLTLTKKLTVGFTVPIICIALITGIVFKNTNSLLAANDWVNHTHEVIREANLIMAAMVDMETGMRGFLVTGVDEFLEPYMGGKAVFQQKISKLKKTVSDNPIQVKRLEEVEALSAEWLNIAAEPAIALRRSIELEKSPADFIDISKFAQAGKGKKSMDGIRDKIGVFISLENDLIKTRIATATSLGIQTEILTILVSLLSLIIAVGLGSYIVRNVKLDVGGEPRVIANISEKIAKGDLSSISNARNETGIYAAILGMATQLQTIIKKINSSTQKQANLATQLSTLSVETSDAVSQQDHATELVAVAIDQMKSSASEVAQRTIDAANAAQTANRLVASSKDTTHETESSIKILAQTLEDTESGVKELSLSIQNISGILGVIKSIADQTNLLALNAAIEAARAGEQGRGFAVVADEVRSLASNTQNSTQEIESMILKIQKNSESSEAAMTAGRNQIGGIVEKIAGLVNALTAIDDSVTTVSNMTQQIATAAEQQSTTSAEVSERATEIRQHSNKTTQNMLQLNVTARDINGLADEMVDIVSVFKLRDA